MVINKQTPDAVSSCHTRNNAWSYYEQEEVHNVRAIVFELHHLETNTRSFHEQDNLESLQFDVKPREGHQMNTKEENLGPVLQTESDYLIKTKR